MFWVKTAFRVGWDTSFQPQGWATSSTAALSLWRKQASGTRVREKERHAARGRLESNTAQDSESPRIKLGCKCPGFAVWHMTVFSLSLSVSAVKTQCCEDSRVGRGHGGAEVCHCWQRQRKNAGTVFLSVAMTRSTSVVWPVFGSSSRSLHVICVTGTDVCCVLQVWNHWVQHATNIYTTNPLI